MDRPPIAEIPPNHPPRSLQQVITLSTRKSVISWMIEDKALHGLVGLNARTIPMFPEHFRGNRSANLIKANHWWQQQDNFSTEDENNTIQYSCSRSRLGIKKCHSLKSQPGRGKKRSDWVQYLYPKLLEAFERHKKSGVKFSSKLLRELALSVLVAPNSIFTDRSVDPKDNVLLINKITSSWITQFMDIQNIILLSQRGRLTCSPEKGMQIEMQTAFHLGILQRGFASQEFNENLMENLDETHFVVNFDNGRTLGFMGDTTVKYVEVVSGGESMTMVVRISGGRCATIEAHMLIFSNENRSYPIRGLLDNILRISYRTGPKGSMDQAIFLEYFSEPRAYQADLHNRMKIIWLKNCSGHAFTPALSVVLDAKNSILKYLLSCSSHLCQPADTFLISKIKDAWTRRWEAKKRELIQENAWQNIARADGHSSGKLTNRGKRFFLQLAADSVEDVNQQVDSDNISYARKAMIRCRLLLGLDGSWSVGQLFPHLQEIIAKHLQYFQGQRVPFVNMPI